jgi:hypothetical protein
MRQVSRRDFIAAGTGIAAYSADLVVSMKAGKPAASGTTYGGVISEIALMGNGARLVRSPATSSITTSTPARPTR